MKQLIRKILKEQVSIKSSQRDNMDIVEEFVDFCTDYLGLDGDINIQLHDNRDELTTYAQYDMGNNINHVQTSGRSMGDYLRSLAHELVHQQQMQNGYLTGDAKEGEDGSPQENEANAVAGIIMRKFGKIRPEIFEL